MLLLIGLAVVLGRTVAAQGVAAVASAPANSAEQTATVPALMPLPASWQTGIGSMSIDSGFHVVLLGYREARLDRAAQRLQQRIGRKTGISFLPVASEQHPALTVRTEGASKAVQELGEDESYQLQVTTAGATLVAANPLGVLRGMQTFLQLIRLGHNGFVVDAANVHDQPRFPWRGLLLDSSRHFLPLANVLEQLDAMEMVKMNVLHWHLSDDQGFRAESLRFPKLHGLGSDGHFYTQQQIRDVIAYAHDRGIRVVPEFDMPGHARSWFVGYPELAAMPGPYGVLHHLTVQEWEHPDPGQDPAMDPTREEVYRFLDGFVGEMAALFPDAYFHIGGDECDGKQWDATPHVQAFMKAHQLKDNPALQAYFTGRVQHLVTEHGKIPVGWDEVLQADTPKTVVIQSWRGQRSLFQAVSRGYRGILSAGYYIDLNQPAGQHYLVDPAVLPAPDQRDPTASGEVVPEHLSPQQEAGILGGEATEWTEYISPEILSNRVWPRLAAIAERLWSPQADRDASTMYARLDWVSHELRLQGIQNGGVLAPMVERMANAVVVDRLMDLGAIVQPPLDYQRESLPGQSYDEYRPLIHMADAVPAESGTARQFAVIAHAIATGKATSEEHAQARQLLLRWSHLDADEAAWTSNGDLTAELVPVAHSASRSAKIGLLALDCMEHATCQASPSKEQTLAELDRLETLTPAALRNMIAEPVGELVKAAR